MTGIEVNFSVKSTKKGKSAAKSVKQWPAKSQKKRFAFGSIVAKTGRFLPGKGEERKPERTAGKENAFGDPERFASNLFCPGIC